MTALGFAAWDVAIRTGFVVCLILRTHTMTSFKYAAPDTPKGKKSLGTAGLH